MSQHYRLSRTKQQYRALFAESRQALDERLIALQKPDGTSARAAIEALFARYPSGDPSRIWQQTALNTLENDIAREILASLQRVEAYRNTFSCHMCGVCCRMASSEYSYDELRERARQGDAFAADFTSVFLPYASREAAMAKYPEVVSAVLGEAEESGKPIHFYHCPYIGEDNRCSVYGTDKRPAICGSYPETPLSYVYEKCAWKPWKDETHGSTMLAHAMLALCESYAARIRQALA